MSINQSYGDDILQDAQSGWKPLVLTVSSAAQKSSWQDAIHRVLKPHFVCRGFPYKNLGGRLWRPNIIIDLRCCLAAFALIVSSFLVEWPLYVVTATLAVAAAALGVQLARRYRAACANVMAVWMTDQGDVQPHVVANGFGSYLVGAALSDPRGVKVRNTIMRSAPLPRQYPWLQILRRARDINVRSEIVRANLLTRLFRLLPLFCEDMGDAGSHGFDHGDAVHTAGSDGYCEQCRLKAFAPIHNVTLDLIDGRESEARLYIQGYWLPFLWNIPIYEYQILLSHGQRILELLRAGRFSEAEEAAGAVLDREFDWTDERPLRQWIRTMVNNYLGFGGQMALADDVVHFVSDRFLPNIAIAHEESLKSDEQNEKVIQSLNPHLAMARLVETAVRQQWTRR
ncbi:hypothetical protein [Bradyrhizobium sp. ERR14]|uniref:hypothetical protein n=1 Tax=Bradyrhizobium sp. ERR14 TaxID=2663837 RepID=UPI001617FE1B|nr:hypothetical protein [Bradyrhizobium sp. ERR14]MBB4398534.1 hypothetical protein [Bradyrhizobium sp. ERR14]